VEKAKNVREFDRQRNVRKLTKSQENVAKKLATDNYDDIMA